MFPTIRCSLSRGVRPYSVTQIRLASSRSRHARAKVLTYEARKPEHTPPAPPRKTLAAVPKRRRLVLIGCGIFSAFLVSYAGLIYWSFERDAKKYANIQIPDDVSDRYAHTANRFDQQVATYEKLAGIERLRKQLVSRATGHVLETACGTGRNTKHWPLLGNGIKSLTMVDSCREMVDESRLNWWSAQQGWFSRAAWRVHDAREPVPCPYHGGFDTVVQTMGICSCPEPVKLLQNMGRMCNSDGGQILLLEHGRSHYSWLNRFIDRAAPAHADREGCWYNKDIGEIVMQSGLEIIEEKRFYWGTVWWYVLKPSKRQREEHVGHEGQRQEPATTPSWLSWRPW